MEIDLTAQFRELMAAARLVSEDVGDVVGQVLREGAEHPLPAEEARALLTRVVEVMRASALDRDDAPRGARSDRHDATVRRRPVARTAPPLQRHSAAPCPSEPRLPSA